MAPLRPLEAIQGYRFERKTASKISCCKMPKDTVTYSHECSREENQSHKSDDMHRARLLLGLAGDILHIPGRQVSALCVDLVDLNGFVLENGVILRKLVLNPSVLKSELPFLYSP